MNYFALNFCIAVILTAVGVGTISDGMTHGLILLAGSSIQWYIVGKAIIHIMMLQHMKDKKSHMKNCDFCKDVLNITNEN